MRQCGLAALDEVEENGVNILKRTHVNKGRNYSGAPGERERQRRVWRQIKKEISTNPESFMQLIDQIMEGNTENAEPTPE